MATALLTGHHETYLGFLGYLEYLDTAWCQLVTLEHVEQQLSCVLMQSIPRLG